MKRIFSVWPFLIYLSYPISVWTALHLRGWWTLLPISLGGFIYPLVDEVWKSPHVANHAVLSRAHYRWLQWLYVPIHFALLVFAFEVFSTHALSGLVAAGLCMGFATMSGAIAFPLAHEFVHSRRATERGLGLALLLPLFYMHFRIEHVYGHHRNVATPEDPATARFGENLFSFIPRTVTGSFLSAIRIENARLRKQGHRCISIRNRMLQYVLIELLFFGSTFAVWGVNAFYFLLLQAVISVLFLEIVNYIEHYGLTRGVLNNGEFEPVGPSHSWNTDRKMTNLVLFNLGLHSHHHTKPIARFEELTNLDKTPQLPAGYFVLIILATIPPLWRRVMDPAVKQFEAPSPAGTPDNAPSEREPALKRGARN